ncbi:MAG: cytochrome c biogenesis protein CcdA [Pseudobdellovibrio sp.]
MKKISSFAFHIFFAFILTTVNTTFVLAQNNDSQASHNAEFKVLTENLVIQQGQVKTAKIQMTMPSGFHAYADQFKIININPNTFKVGQILLSPEIEFYDKHFKKKRKGLFENGEIEIQIEAPENLDTEKTNTLLFDLKYQICSEQVCYLPKTFSIQLKINTSELKAATHSNQAFSPFSADTIENQLSKNFLLTYLFVFIAGVLTSFTPCIFPMIPITLSILGHDAEKKSRAQNVARSVFYVLGIAITYSLLGVIAALTGSIFGQALSNKYVIMTLVTLFVFMALSMWGAFELQVPAFIRNKFGTGQSKGYIGSFIMGLVAGLVASPCVGPVLVSILSFVSTTQSVSLGFTLLFTYAMGLGLIFIVLGFSGQILKKLPKSGPWMEFIKFALGLLMILAALYYLKFILPIQYWAIVTGLSFMSISVWQGTYNFRKKHPFRQGLFIVTFILSLLLTLMSIIKFDYVAPFFENKIGLVSESKIKWIPYSKQVLEAAIQEKQPVMLDFFAEWCGACHELEEKTYTHSEFIELSQQFKLVKIDATEDLPEVQKILEEYHIKGLPTVIFINKKGEILNDLTFTQFLEWNELKPKMLKALE